MSKIVNEANLKDHETQLLRNAIGHRATWMALMYLEAKKNGCDAEKITRDAIRKTGHIQGAKIKEGLENKEDVTYFKEAFLTPGVIKYFEMEVTDLDVDELKVEFNYCPLVDAWRDLDIDDETIDLLCDMAMDGDRGIAEAMGLEFELGDTIAKGCPQCKLHFSSKK
jgi:L-2-amino-thiazoline-4-carboxylic acid hydrolase-like protein